jgi:hypothetical protein
MMPCMVCPVKYVGVSGQWSHDHDIVINSTQIDFCRYELRMKPPRVEEAWFANLQVGRSRGTSATLSTSKVTPSPRGKMDGGNRAWTMGEKKRPGRLPIAQARPAWSLSRGVALYQVDPLHIEFANFPVVLRETILTVGRLTQGSQTRTSTRQFLGKQ